MSIEIGNKLKGKVTGIRKFSAFVGLSKGKSGLVRTSEVTNSYAENVGEHLSVSDETGVKVLSITDDEKTSLSIRKAKDHPRRQRTSKPSHQKPVQKAEDFEKKLSNFLRGSEDRLTSIKCQTESRRGGKDSRR